MKKLFCYKTGPIWDIKTIPPSFLEKNSNQIGLWTKINILSGSLAIDFLTERLDIIESHHLDVNNPSPFIEPQKWYRITKVSSDIKCQLSFFCLAEDYTQKKYEMTKTHSEVLAASHIVPIGKALDLGCGSGRNSLYLQLLGFDIDAVDKSLPSIDNLKQIIENEQLKKMTATAYDINQANWQGEYDLIISTVVMMFLEQEKIPSIIQNMQSMTRLGGYNLIVSAMSTEDYPCTVGFSFTFKEGELRNYYQDWEIIKYNENLGELHKTDLKGNRIKLKFATLLAKKR